MFIFNLDYINLEKLRSKRVRQNSTLSSYLGGKIKQKSIKIHMKPTN